MGLLIVSVVLALMWCASDRRLERMSTEVHRPQDVPFEQKAISLNAQFEHVPTSEFAELVLPLTIHLPGRRCVKLRPQWGVAGATNIYCVDAQNLRLLEHQSVGE